MLRQDGAAGADRTDLTALGGENCAICLKEMAAGAELLALPCGHTFHPECGRESLKHRQRCPTCRAPVVTGEEANRLCSNYLLPLDERILDRLKEFLTSGMCERCQMANVEGTMFRETPRTDRHVVFDEHGRVNGPSALSSGGRRRAQYRGICRAARRSSSSMETDTTAADVSDPSPPVARETANALESFTASQRKGSRRSMRRHERSRTRR